MAGNSVFIPANAHGWRSGLGNLLRADFGKWFRTRLWWVQALIWMGVIDGMLGVILWGSGGTVSFTNGLMLYMIFSGLFPAIATVIIMQDAIVGEREAGTAAWVLSKPVARAAFVLSKLFPTLIGTLVSMLLIPGVIAYVQLSAANGAALNPLRFLAAIGVMWVNLAFYLTLTLMLGTFFDHRGPVVGIPLGLNFGQQLIFGIAPLLAKILPWTLVVPLNGTDASIASAVLLGQPLPDVTPFYAALVSIVLFVAVALWKFEREEF